MRSVTSVRPTGFKHMLYGKIRMMHGYAILVAIRDTDSIRVGNAGIRVSEYKYLERPRKRRESNWVRLSLFWIRLSLHKSPGLRI